MRVRRAVDIVVTIGPSSWTDEVLEDFMDAGVRFVRFPIGKEPPQSHLDRARAIRESAMKKGINVNLIADIPGGKPRLSNTKPINIRTDEAYKIGLGADCNGGVDIIVSPTLGLLKLSPGDTLVIGDGENTFQVNYVNEYYIEGKFLRAGILERRRAMLPKNQWASFSSFTQYDRDMLMAFKELDFDWLALSFVDSSQDIQMVKSWVESELGWKSKIIAKIESQLGLANVEEISRSADALMAARGDLALQIGFESLWQAQLSIIRAAKRQGKLAMVATGFMESFATTLIPSRAEVVDVCTALSMGTEAIMLSSETTIGRFPVETVQFLQTIADSWRG